MQRLSNGGGEFKIRRRSAIPPSFIRTCRRHTVVQHCIERHMNVRAQISRTLLSFVAIASILTCAGCGGGTSSGNPGAPTWNYTALGDSLASGLIAQEGYVTRYANYVNVDTGATVNTTNLGVPGWHSGDLLNALQNDAAFRASIQSAQVVTFDIGGNDVANAHDHYVQGICLRSRQSRLPAQCGFNSRTELDCNCHSAEYAAQRERYDPSDHGHLQPGR